MHPSLLKFVTFEKDMCRKDWIEDLTEKGEAAGLMMDPGPAKMVRILKDNVDKLFKGQLKRMLKSLQVGYTWKDVVKAFCSFENTAQYSIKLSEYESFTYELTDDDVQGYTLRFGNLMESLDDLSPRNAVISVHSKLLKFTKGLYSYNRNLAEKTELEDHKTYLQASKTASRIEAVLINNKTLKKGASVNKISTTHADRQQFFKKDTKDSGQHEELKSMIKDLMAVNYENHQKQRSWKNETSRRESSRDKRPRQDSRDYKSRNNKSTKYESSSRNSRDNKNTPRKRWNDMTLEERRADFEEQKKNDPDGI
jgi:hypothetical protein